MQRAGFLERVMGPGPGGGVVVIKVDGEEMRLWKEVLPAWVERCRGGEWVHREGCEYYHRVAEGEDGRRRWGLGWGRRSFVGVVRGCFRRGGRWRCRCGRW